MILTRRDHTGRRSGKILVLFALLLPVLFGMLGLAIDAGMMLASHRQAQSAADAAALAAAVELLNGESNACADAKAQSYVQQYNGLADAAVTVNVPPSQGPHAGDSHYVEVFVSHTVDSLFIPVLSGTSAQTISARAVAGMEAIPAPQTLLALDSGASPGIAIEGGAALVNGSVAVNSEGAGSDASGGAVNLGSAPYAVATGSSGVLQATDVSVVGGVDAPGRFQQASGSGGSPLHAGILPFPDPLFHLPPSTVANGVVNVYPGANGQTFGSPQDVSISIAGGATATLSPGVYRSINVTGDGPGTVTFNPGIYVLLGGQPYALQIATGAAVVGNDVLFYNTGSDYDVTTGLPDANDGDALGIDSTSGNTFGAISIQAGSLSLGPLNDPASQFNNLAIYQRRWNPQAVVVKTAAAADGIAGGVYARWAKVTLSGPGTYNGQVVAGALSLLPQASGGMTCNRGPKLPKAMQVYLVE
jgi:Flp pilus assembly protein TadG